MHTFDVIVIGLGGMGTAAAAELARRGRTVLGLEQFPLAHDRGSSHGHTRIIRRAYYEHPDYVPLACRSFDRWHDLEQATGRHLLTSSPCLSLGIPESELILGVRAAATQHQLPIANLTPAEIADRFPAFGVPEGTVGVLEEAAGFLYVEECVRAQANLATKHGADLRFETPVLGWTPRGEGVDVRTADQTFHSARLVVTAGAWATELLADVGVPFTVMRQVLQWFAPMTPAIARRDRFPVYIADTAAGAFYGLPALDGRGHKCARHYGAPELPGPAAVDRTVSEADAEPVHEFLHSFAPTADGPRTAAQVCLYTLTPDRHFVIDLHPHFPQIAVAAGFSGHGFKFAPVVGEILADLVESGTSRLPIDLFRATRFAR